MTKDIFLYILEVDIKYPKDLHDLHSDLPFLPERMKISKCNKPVYSLFNKKKLCYLNKKLKKNIKPWINSEKSAKSNSI